MYNLKCKRSCELHSDVYSGAHFSEGFKKTRFMKPGFRKCRPLFQLVPTLLEMSAVKQVQKNKHMFKSRACFDYIDNSQVGEAVPLKKPSSGDTILLWIHTRYTK